MNKRNIILTIVIALFVAFGIYSQKSQDLEDELAEISNSPYDVSQFDEITDREFLNADNGLTGFVYIGREDCIGCKVLAQGLTQISKENDIKISYFDTKKYRDSKSYKEIVDKYQIEQVPDFLLVKKMELMKNLVKKILKTEKNSKIGLLKIRIVSCISRLY